MTGPRRPIAAGLDLLTHHATDPFFVPAPRNGVISAWYGHVPFAYWIVNALQPRVLVELGTHNGVSYAAFCDAVVRAGLDTRCFAVDTWKGDEHAGYYGEEVYRDLAAFHAPRFAAFSELIRSTFDDAREYFEDGAIDLLHIDGCHSHEAVRRDFDHWRPKLSSRAVVLFHDTNVRERQFGVWRLWAELRQTHPGFEFLHGHGLGVLALGKDVPAGVREFCGVADLREIAEIRRRFAFAGHGRAIEAEVERLRREVEPGAAAHAEVERLVGQLNDTHLLAQTISGERDALRAERDKTVAERDAARAERDKAVAERNFALAARDAVRADGDAARKARDAAQAERERAVSERKMAIGARDTAVAARAAAILERDAAVAERDAARRDQDHRKADFDRELTRLLGVARIQEQRARLVRERLAETSRREREADQARAAESAAVVAALRREVGALAAHHMAFEQSTAWRMTWPARAIAGSLPPRLRRAGRITLQAAWWMATPTRLAARLRARRGIGQPDPAPTPTLPSPDHVQIVPSHDAPAPPVDRYSLDHIKPASGDGTAVLDWYDPLEPEISIVVLNWNRSDMTLLCLDHLWQHTKGHRYEVIVVDNGSAPEHVAALRDNALLARIIPLGANRYFGEANNIGVEAARGRYICFLNNDAFVHDGWLEPLVAVLAGDSRIGAVGPRFLYPDGRLQEAGALVDPDGGVIQIGKGEREDDPLFFYPRRVDFTSGACMLVRRAEFLEVLGFDLAWDPAYYEDVDLCLKLRLKGLQTFYCPRATVTHIENATSSGTSHDLKLNNIIAINRPKFAARWGEFLRTCGAETPNLIPRAAAPRPSPPGAPRVLIYTPYNITPGGGERYFLTIAEAFRGMAEVALVTPGPFSRLRLLTMGREFGLVLDHVQQVTMDRMLEIPPFDLAFVVGNEIFPPIGRMGSHNVFICQFPFPIEDESYARRARPFWNEYDLLLTYSSFVRGHATRRVAELGLPARPIEVLCPPVPLLAVGREKRAMILHVGRFFVGGHTKRQDVLIEALRRLVAAGVRAELHLAGSIHPEGEHRDYYTRLVESAAGLPVHFHANCSAEKLRALYTQSRIYWHATGFGNDVDLAPQTTEHFGISVVEAMSAGCIPVVYAAGGPAEVVEPGVTGFHFRTIDELCARTRDLLEETPAARLAELADAAANAARAYDENVFKESVRVMARRFIAV